MAETYGPQNHTRTPGSPARPAATVRAPYRPEPPVRPAKRAYLPPSFATRSQLLRATLLVLAGAVWFAPPQPYRAHAQFLSQSPPSVVAK